VRPLGHAAVHKQDAAFGRGGRGQPAEHSGPDVVVPDVGLVHEVQGHFGRDRLAGRGAAIWFQGVPEPAVGITVGGQRVPHRLRGAAFEQALVPALVNDPRVRGQELDCFFHVWSRRGHHLTAPASPPS
jgi:hypothetical protein